MSTEYKKLLQQAWFNLAVRLPIEDVKVAQRLDRAKEIIRLLGSRYTLKHITGVNRFRKLQDGESFWLVYKESTSLLEDNSVYYMVDENGCTCPDAHTARAGLCKHRLATMLIEEMLVE